MTSARAVLAIQIAMVVSGFAALAYGVGLWSRPAGFALAGGLLLVGGLAGALRSGKGAAE